MQNMKTITFDQPFNYSVGGIYHQATQVTVVEPSYKRRDVHYRMRGYMGETEIALAKAFAGVQLKVEASLADEDEAHIAKPEKNPDPDGSGLMEQMRIALGEKRFPEFIDYVHGKLTGDRVLCFIGNDGVPEEERLAVSPLHWEQIADAGGLEAVDKVLMAFVSFFEAPGSKTPTKAAKPTSGGEPLLLSPVSPPARSRSRQGNS